MVNETALVVRSLEEVNAIAKILVDSGMAPGVKNIAQAATKVLAGQELGIPPMAAIRGIHFIEGSMTLSAGLMSSMIKSSNRYSYAVVTKNADGCSLEFFQDKDKLGESSFTMEDAERAELINKPGPGGRPGNWKKYPEDMCFARALSRGARTFCSDLFFGAAYVPGEIEVHMPTRQESIEAAFEEMDQDDADWNAPGNMADQLRIASDKQRGYICSFLAKSGVDEGDKRDLIDALYPEGFHQSHAMADIDQFKAQDEDRLLDKYFVAYLRLLRERHGVDKEELRDFILDYTGSAKPINLETEMQRNIIEWIATQNTPDQTPATDMSQAWEAMISGIIVATGYPRADIEAWLIAEFGDDATTTVTDIDNVALTPLGVMTAKDFRDQITLFMRAHA